MRKEIEDRLMLKLQSDDEVKVMFQAMACLRLRELKKMLKDLVKNRAEIPPDIYSDGKQILGFFIQQERNKEVSK